MKPEDTILNFPGAKGDPGLILDGGVINLAVGGNYTLEGVVEVKSKGFIDGATQFKVPNRLELVAQLRGAGTLVFTRSLTNMPRIISGDASKFSGKWVVTSGWLAAEGKNSLGTNDITIDPKAPAGAKLEAYSEIASQAVLEPRSDIQSAGTLTLKNGGMMCLHQNCSFAVVSIEGVGLRPGMYPYVDLVKSFPQNFLPNGSGSIIVQPFSTASIPSTRTPAAPTAAAPPATPAKHTIFGTTPMWYLILGIFVCIIGLLLGLIIALKVMIPSRSSSADEER
jgi:hypothetical protein